MKLKVFAKLAFLPNEIEGFAELTFLHGEITSFGEPTFLPGKIDKNKQNALLETQDYAN